MTKPEIDPHMQAGQTFDESDLAKAAREAWEASGITQAQAADQLGVKTPTFNQALNDPQRSLASLRVRIIEAFTPYQVKGPMYELVEKDRS